MATLEFMDQETAQKISPVSEAVANMFTILYYQSETGRATQEDFEQALVTIRQVTNVFRPCFIRGRGVGRSRLRGGDMSKRQHPGGSSTADVPQLTTTEEHKGRLAMVRRLHPVELK